MSIYLTASRHTGSTEQQRGGQLCSLLAGLSCLEGLRGCGSSPAASKGSAETKTDYALKTRA